MARTRAITAVLIVVAVGCTPAPALADGFSTAPNLPTLGPVTLNGRSQTVNNTMNDWSVVPPLLLGNFHVNVNSDSSAGHSAVFKQWCPGPSNCGSDPPGYVAGGATLASGSLTLNSTGATFKSGGVSVGNASLTCNSGCLVDTTTPVKVATGGSVLSVATYTATNWSATSLALALPTTARVFPNGEVYHLDVVWTYDNSGP